VTTSSPGNIQPWKAIVVEQARIDPDRRRRLLQADNMQAGHAQAPVWIYWFGDTACVGPAVFKTRMREMLRAGAAPPPTAGPRR